KRRQPPDRRANDTIAAQDRRRSALPALSGDRARARLHAAAGLMASMVKSLHPILQALELMLPRSLLGRSIMIIVTPVVLLQVVSAWVFYDSHWNTVTRRLAQSVAGDIAAAIQMMPRPINEERAQRVFRIARDSMRINLDFKPGDILPNDPTIMRQNLVD